MIDIFKVGGAHKALTYDHVPIHASLKNNLLPTVVAIPPRSRHWMLPTQGLQEIEIDAAVIKLHKSRSTQG
jgi:hypothetical protein